MLDTTTFVFNVTWYCIISSSYHWYFVVTDCVCSCWILEIVRTRIVRHISKRWISNCLEALHGMFHLRAVETLNVNQFEAFLPTSFFFDKLDVFIVAIEYKLCASLKSMLSEAVGRIIFTIEKRCLFIFAQQPANKTARNKKRWQKFRIFMRGILN